MILFFIPYFLYTYLKILHGMHMLQQNFYNESNRYLKWILRNKDKSLITIDWITLLLPFTFIVNTSFGYICGFVLYSIFSLQFELKIADKSSLLSLSVRLAFCFNKSVLPTSSSRVRTPSLDIYSLSS